MRSQKKYDEHVATEEEDQTGDSGMGTGSGTTSYGTIEEWKGSIQNPPPESHKEHRYQQIMTETTDQVQPYTPVEFNQLTPSHALP
jgi:hypothetical protein